MSVVCRERWKEICDACHVHGSLMQSLSRCNPMLATISARLHDVDEGKGYSVCIYVAKATVHCDLRECLDLCSAKVHVVLCICTNDK